MVPLAGRRAGSTEIAARGGATEARADPGDLPDTWGSWSYASDGSMEQPVSLDRRIDTLARAANASTTPAA